MISNSPMKLPHPGDAERTDNGCVIVVDDEPQVRALFRTFLEIAGYKVSEAHCAQAALKLMSSSQFDLVLTDVKMPGISGIDLLREVKRAQYGVPVILVTGIDDQGLAVECMKAGASDFLIKPIGSEALAAAVGEALVGHDDTGSPVGHSKSQPVATDQIQGYKLLGMLGEGTMGIVHLAERSDRNGTEQYAIKIVKTSGRDERNLHLNQRFRREVQTLAGLEHPNIVRLADYGVSIAHGAPYLVMEYINGRSLKLYCTGLLSTSVRERLQFIRQLADAISTVHQAGVLHRDLKPDNILVLPDGQIKLMDFGIVSNHDSDLTRTGQIIGTPEYMAPETLLRGETDERSDIFGIGVIAYELLVQTRYPRSHGMPTVESYKFVRPEEPRLLVPEIPIALQGILAKMLKENPAKRYSTAMAVVRDLDKCLNAEDMSTVLAFRGYEKNDWRGSPTGFGSALKSLMFWRQAS